MIDRDLTRAAIRGEPSYVWRAGQERRFEMIRAAAGERINGRLLDIGCGIGVYLERLSQFSALSSGIEFDISHARSAREKGLSVAQAAGEMLPFPKGTFDLVLSHEVLEHVQDDKASLNEIVRVLKIPQPESGQLGGRLILFVPNKGYPVETHGIYLRGRYRFGNIPLINYLPRGLRNSLAPHVRVYSRRDLDRLFSQLPLQTVERKIIFGAYDNLIAKWPKLGRGIRWLLHKLEKTPLQFFGLSHFWVLERISPPGDSEGRDQELA